MVSFTQWDNALYSGDKFYVVVPKHKAFASLAAAVIVVELILTVAIEFNRSIEFTGGAQLSVTGVSDQSEAEASDIVMGADPIPNAEVTRVDANGVRAQTEPLGSDQTAQVRDALVSAYGVDTPDMQSSTINPSWGRSVTTKALQSLAIFMALIAVLMTVYFHSWAMAAAALLALVHNVAVTFAVFVIAQVEVSPATVIDFLTILEYSLYDAIVVFDKVRELTRGIYDQRRFAFAEFVNLAVNQAMVCSISTSVVAPLPVGAILIIGSLLLGTDTLTDISLAPFVGMIAGTYSSIFIASPLPVILQKRMKKMHERDGVMTRDHQARTADSSQGTPAPVKVAPVVAGRRLSNTHQPKRKKAQR